LVDDLLTPDMRDAIDRQAIERLREWRNRRDSDLTLDGVCLSQIWEVELLAEVFLPETRIVSGLQAVFEAASPRRVECEGVDRDRVTGLRSLLAGIEVVSSGPPIPPPHYPSVLASPWRVPLPVRVALAILRTIGVPQHVRGEVYLHSYWHLLPVFERLAITHGLRPVLDPGSPPKAELSTLLRGAVRGGWVGYPGAVDRRRSRRSLGRALAAARANVGQLDVLSRLLDVRALDMLEQRAGDTLAVVSQIRKSFSCGSLKVAVLPFDSPPDARAIVQAARDCAVPTLVVQHGLFNEPNEPDKTLADAVAVWAAADADYVRSRTSAMVAVTGNPGAATGLDALRKMEQPGVARTIILVEYASRLSVRVDNRVSLRHVSAALRGLEKARPGTAVTIRPHPAEHEPEIFERAASLYGELKVDVETTSSIAELFTTADLCIGAVSTATLQAAAAGVPVVFLNVTARPARWPFDGSTGVPVASNSEELATLIIQVLSSGSVPGRAEMLEVLGADVDAVDRVIDFMRTIAEPPAG
jgi:hypothetical protein